MTHTESVSHPMHKAGLSYGFTLLELLWVLFILSILLSVVVPNFSGTLFQIGMEEKAREIFTAFSYLQQQALNQSDTFGLFFDLTKEEVTCYRQSAGYDLDGKPVIDPNNTLRNPLTQKPYLIELNQEGGDIHIDEADFGGNNWVELNPLGEPNLVGLVTLTGGGASHTITVNRIGRLDFE